MCVCVYRYRYINVLQNSQAELKVVVDKLEAMEAKLAELAKTKKELEDKYEDCNQKLERAEKLMGGLGGEKVISGSGLGLRVTPIHIL